MFSIAKDDITQDGLIVLLGEGQSDMPINALAKITDMSFAGSKAEIFC